MRDGQEAFQVSKAGVAVLAGRRLVQVPRHIDLEHFMSA